MNEELKNAITYWHKLAPFLAVPEDEADYDKKAQHLDQLLDIVGSDETHELMPLIDLLSNAIAEYDAKHFKL